MLLLLLSCYYKNMKDLTLTIFVLVCQIANAQPTIQVLDAESKEGIPGVLIEFLSTDGKQADAFITDIDGKAKISLSGEYDIRVTHLSYIKSEAHFKGTDMTILLNTNTETLRDVVVTGQYLPQSAAKSVYNVKTVRATTIQDQGSVQLQEVLSKQLNIRVSPDMALGSNSMSLQGIQGRNVKILVDGVPLVNRNGNGNDADLSQINMANIARVEIVEGPMAVNYGANAMAGVINLITKAPKKNSYRVGIDLQGETINQEYGLHAGNTNINLTSAAPLTKKFMLSLNGGATRFGGFQGDNTGREYVWNPKDQLFYDASLWYKTNNHSFHYKFEQLHEIINDAGALQEYTQPATGAIRYFGFDADYISNRSGHQFQADGKLSDFLRYNFVASYANFERRIENYRLWLDTNEKIINEDKLDTTSFRAFITRGTIQNINPAKFYNYQIGYDVNIESTKGGRILGNDGKVMEDYAAFLSFEFNLHDKLTIRPGLRGSYNSIFGGWVSPSVNLKIFVTHSFDISAAYGNGYRAPSLRELYFDFIDATHTVIGNEDLTPEYSNHYSINLRHGLLLGTGELTSRAQVFYNNIKDLINFQFDPNDATYAKYFNLNRLETLGFNLSEGYEGKIFNFTMGLGLIGRKEFDVQAELPDKYFYSPEVSIDANYKEPFSCIKFNIFYKFNGKTSQYQFDASDNLVIGTLDGYGLLDATMSRRFFGSTTIAVGAKNIMNVTTLANSSASAITGGIHTGSSQSTIGYGRSFFLKIAYNLNSELN